MIAFMLALALQGMTEADYNAARARENPTVSQAQVVVTEAIQRGEACDPESTVVCSGYGDSVIVTVNSTPKRSECIIESAQRMTCVRSTQLSPSHVNFDPPSVNEADPLDVGAIVAAERAWVGLGT